MNKEHMNKEGMLNKEDITELLELSHLYSILKLCILSCVDS